jgi:integrase/recombinase XerD
MENDEKPQDQEQELSLIPVTRPVEWTEILEPGPGRMRTSDEDRPSGNVALSDALLGWLTKSASLETRKAYARDLTHFFRFVRLAPDHLDQIKGIRPFHVAAWRDHLHDRGLVPASIGRKITVLRSLYAYLQVHGLADTNPAHRDLVTTPPVPRDGKTVGLSPQECRRMLDAPDSKTLAGVRDRALLAVLAFTGCRVGELCRMRVGDIKRASGHRIIEIRGKGNKERRVPLHREAADRIDLWLASSCLYGQPACALFPPARSARGRGTDGFQNRHQSPRAVQQLIARYVRGLGLDPAVTVHSFRVTALTTARENGCDLVDIQTFAGHSDPKTTLAYIRNRDRLSKSPAYALAYGPTAAPPETVVDSYG